MSHIFGYTLRYKITTNKENLLFTTVFHVSLFSIKRDIFYLGRKSRVTNRSE